MTRDTDWYERERLHFAASNAQLDEAKKLITSGYDVNAFDEISCTPLHYAARAEDPLMVQLLLESGANPNAHEEAKIGNTPLADVAGRCSATIASLLLDAGADPTIRGWMQLNAIDRASRRTDPEGKKVLQLLQTAIENRRKDS